ncbi:MAG: response regulator [Actinomycetota bacterium]|nr:response regulator [Actinomycetota bacterium]
MTHAADASARVLVVEDDEHTRSLLASTLSGQGYHATAVDDAARARAFLAQEDFSLVITGVDTSGLSGLSFVMELRQDYPNAAVFILTPSVEPGVINDALELGAYGYMAKPVEPEEVLVNVAHALRLRAADIESRRQSEQLQGLIRARTDDLRDAVTRLQRIEKELSGSREETIERLSIAAEFRDNETIKHIKRVSGYCEILARGAGYDEQHCDMIRIASKLHDVGKIGMPDHILAKTGPLTDQERAITQQHTEIGYRILSGSSSEVLSIAASIALTHHERFDGKGYPRGLSGESIPIEGRILAVADVFDGLTSRRVYKGAVPLDEAVAVMRAESDHQLDGDLVDVFLSSMDYIKPIKERYSDG